MSSSPLLEPDGLASVLHQAERMTVSSHRKMLNLRNRRRSHFLVIGSVTVIGFVVYLFSFDNLMMKRPAVVAPDILVQPDDELLERESQLVSPDLWKSDGVPDIHFDIQGNDVIVLLHIQKTGGTAFGRHLVRDLNIDSPCECQKGKKRCKCFRPNSDGSNKLWLFSRYSTGWRCGLHADWTELTNCVDIVMDESEKQSIKRRYFYITQLRDPVSRFLSEFRHVQRGATWKTARHWCGGRVPTSQELPPCYLGPDWRDVTLREFMTCPHNLAINRQTRMLADLTLVGCYNTSIMSKKQRDALLLASAKDNLRRMVFFGLVEAQQKSQYLFEWTFGMHFKNAFAQLNETHSSLTINEMTNNDLLDEIKSLNYLDVELYKYAKNLLNERFNRVKALDKGFEYNFSHLGKANNYNGKFFNDNSNKVVIIEENKRIDRLLSGLTNSQNN